MLLIGERKNPTFLRIFVLSSSLVDSLFRFFFLKKEELILFSDLLLIISILYNRGVYPEESFVKVKKYGLPMLLTQDEGVKTFIANLTAQLSGI